MSLVSYRRSTRRPARVQRPAPSAAPGTAMSEPVNWPPEWLDFLRRSWGELHRRALSVRSDDGAWLGDFVRRLPCGSCREHWNQMLLRNPPRWADYFAWTVEIHNTVNTRMGKPVFTIAQAAARWAPRPSPR